MAHHEYAGQVVIHVQGGENPEDVLSLQVISVKEPYN